MSTLKLKGSSSGEVEITVPATVADQTITFPAAAPTAGTSLKATDTSGTLEWGSSSVGLVNSVTGRIVKDTATNIDIRVSGITGTVSIKYYEGATLHATVASQTVTNGKITTAVPSAVYDETVGDVISIEVVDSGGTASSNRYDVQVVALPTGGTVTTDGSAKIHTFNETDTFFNTIDGLSVEYLVVGGGGSASGYSGHGGGGGAGGYLTGTFSHLDAGSYDARIGAGAAGGNYNLGQGEDAYNAVSYTHLRAHET